MSPNPSHDFQFLNRELVAGSRDLLSSRSLYGKGVFTTIAIHESTPLLWEKHWRRLSSNATRLGINTSEFSEAATRNGLRQILEANHVVRGRARITFFDESLSPIWSGTSASSVSLAIITGDAKGHDSELRLGVSPHNVNSTSPLAGIKSCNYLEKILALEEAKQRGLDEAIQLNERGEITSACMANVFWSKDDALFTSSLETGCLAGTTREFVLENLECEEVMATIDELKTADEMFLTSAGIGVVQVAEFDGRELQRHDHPIMKLMPPR